MKGKDTKSFLPTTSVNGTIVGPQKNWATLTKKAYVIYMTFKKFSLQCKSNISWDHAPMCKFLTAHAFNSKVNDLGTEFARITYVIF